jgi:hypothetical protein
MTEPMSDDDRAGLMDALLSPLMLSPRAVQDPQALGTAARSVPGFERTLIDRLDELADGAFGLRTELNGSLDRPHGTLEPLDARVATLRNDVPELAGEPADTNERVTEITRPVARSRDAVIGAEASGEGGDLRGDSPRDEAQPLAWP